MLKWYLNIKTSSPFLATPFWLYFTQVHSQLTNFNKNSNFHSIITSNFNETNNSDSRDFNLIYTDASKNIKGTSRAFISRSVIRLLKLPTVVIIFTAETIAIREATIYVESIHIQKISCHKRLSQCLNFITISQPINPTKPSQPISQQIINIIVNSKNTTEFMWVLSHSGIKGNEEVNLLANQAISSTESTAIQSLTYKDLSRIINWILIQQWQSQWDSEINQVISENKLKNITEMAILYKHSPYSDIVTIRSRIGHTHLTHYVLLQSWRTTNLPPIQPTT